MTRHLVLTIRLHGDRQGTARYHGTRHGSPEWPPAPARVFQALLAGVARGVAVPPAISSALEWLESLPAPVIAAPFAHKGERVSFFVPNNDADSLPDPRDVSSIRTQKVVHPTLFDEDVPFVYAWPLAGDAPNASVIAEAAEELYQLGRGVDMAWALGELVDDETFERLLRDYKGTVHWPELGASGKVLDCPAPGSLESLARRFRAPKFRTEGDRRSSKVLFTNAPKAHFVGIAYEPERRRVVYELRANEDESASWPWPLHRAAKLIESLRDSAAARLRQGLKDGGSAIERVLIGRTVAGEAELPANQRARVVPLPSIGHEHADRAIRRVLLEVPSNGPLKAADLEWAFSGLEPVNFETGVVAPFVLARAGIDNMLDYYRRRSRKWQSVTAVALPEGVKRRRVDPLRRREEAKGGAERVAEEARAVAAVRVALRHAGIRQKAIFARVQREPFEAKGARAELFAVGTRFAKEGLWHVELEFDQSVDGPLVIGDGRFLGLGVMAPVIETRSKGLIRPDAQRARRGPRVSGPRNRSGLFVFSASGGGESDPLQMARALRRAVMVRVQRQLGEAALDSFYSGHGADGSAIRSPNANHLSFQWDPLGRRLLVIAPHWLDRREPFREERGAIEIVDRALDTFAQLRAGAAGRLALRKCALADDDSLLSSGTKWYSLTPYAVMRHRKLGSVTDALVEDVRAACYRGRLPRPEVDVIEAWSDGRLGLQGRVRLKFPVAVAGPIVLGRTRFIGGGLFACEIVRA